MSTTASFARVLVFAKAMASSFVPIVTDFGGLRIATCLRTGTIKGFVERPLIAGGGWGVSANKYHLLEVPVSVSPSSWIIQAKCYPFPVKCEVEGF